MTDNPWRKQEAIEVLTAEMKLAASGGDPEISHSEADEALIKFIRTMGAHEAASIFEQMTRWYA